MACCIAVCPFRHHIEKTEYKRDRQNEIHDSPYSTAKTCQASCFFVVRRFVVRLPLDAPLEAEVCAERVTLPRDLLRPSRS
jgi:hypothetical protein